jgi:aryl sulfotransferase
MSVANTDSLKQGNIFWLASYPKSGNTWTRAFIANLLNENPEPVDINEFFTGAIASSREWVEYGLDFDIEELNHQEIDKLRPAAYRWLSQQLKEPGYHKIHDAYTLLDSAEPLLPFDATRGALVIVRNPLDVAISFAHHSGRTIDQTIESMAKPDFAFAKSRKGLSQQLRQKLLSWSAHVASWVDAEGINKLVVRYEDMRLQPLNTFTNMATFLELPNDEASVASALASCDMERLQAQESEKSFKEKSSRAEKFFRKGIVGDWQNTLTDEQVQRVVDTQAEMMHRFGYLDDASQPVTRY